MKKNKACGEWHSPISAEMLSGGSVRLGDIAIEKDTVYWIESCPTEQGRNTIFRKKPGETPENLLDAPFNVRSRVHEYGGGAMHVTPGGIFFSNDGDRQIYFFQPGESPKQLTQSLESRFADFWFDDRHNRLLTVREVQEPNAAEPRNLISAIDVNNQNEISDLISGADFYSNPTISPDGKRLAFLCWHHPNLPWDATELWLANIADDGSIHSSEKIAGGDNESIFQPQWASDGKLYFVSDKSGWWNIYCWDAGKVEPVIEMAAEFGLPQWVFGMSTFGIIDHQTLASAFSKDGIWQFGIIDLPSKSLNILDLPFTYITQVRASRNQIVFQAGTPQQSGAIVSVYLKSGKHEMLRHSTAVEIDPAVISLPEIFRFTSDGYPVQGFFYPPKNPDVAPLPEELPPLMLICHSGPTAATDNSLSLKIQYWTSRGFAVADINYRGSTGFGRAFRELLNTNWGIADVADCVNAATALVADGKVDPQRMVISGGSAGGFTVLAALTFHNVFAAGCSRYGISDLAALTQHTHKFEARYNDRLIAQYPQEKQEYRARSPLYHSEKLDKPVIFFQGSDDKVVLPEQSEKMANALRQKGIPVAYVLLDGEGHGFRQPDNIRNVLEWELYFYSRIFNFRPADEISPINIDNLNN